ATDFTAYEEILDKDGNTINGLAVNAAKEMQKEAIFHFEKDLDVYPMHRFSTFLDADGKPEFKFDSHVTEWQSVLEKVTNAVIDEMEQLAQTRIDNFTPIKEEIGKKLIELSSLDSKVSKAQQELNNVKKLEKTAREGKMQDLKDTFNEINNKSGVKTILTGPDAFDVTALKTALDNDEKALRVAVRAHLKTLKSALEGIETRIILDPVEKNELEEIERYLAGTPVPIEKRILPINGASSKINKAELVKYCKETLAKKPELIDDTYVVIHTIALQELKVDSKLKEQILKEMEDYKDGDKRLDKSKYRDGKEFTEEGIVKYYAEKLGGQNHAKK
ncbi:3810_t:CDS:2, partial [Ambispora leptoticha]